MYLHGGRRPDNTILGDLWALDLGSLTWTRILTDAVRSPPLLFSHTLTAVDAQLLLLGGCPEQDTGAHSAIQVTTWQTVT